MRMLHVGGPRERSSRDPVIWAGLEIHRVRSQFDQLVRYNQHTPQMLPRVSRKRLEAFARAIRDYDVIFCETPEALLAVGEWLRLGLTPLPLLALEVEGLLRVNAMRRWYQAQSDPDPWPALRDSPGVRWLAASAAQRNVLLTADVPEGRIVNVRGCTAHYGMFVAGIEAQLAGGEADDADLAHGLPRDGILLPGGGRRDHVTTLRAVHQLPALPFFLIDELLPAKQHQLRQAAVPHLPNLRTLKPLPLEQFVALVRRARLVVVGLQPGRGDGGHTTVATAHRLGVPVVVTQLPGIADYVTDGVDALTVPPADPAAMASAIRTLWTDPALRARLADAGRRREAVRCEAAPRQLRAAVRSVCADHLGSLPGG